MKKRILFITDNFVVDAHQAWIADEVFREDVQETLEIVVYNITEIYF